MFSDVIGKLILPPHAATQTEVYCTQTLIERIAKHAIKQYNTRRKFSVGSIIGGFEGVKLALEDNAIDVGYRLGVQV